MSHTPTAYAKLRLALVDRMSLDWGTKWVFGCVLTIDGSLPAYYGGWFYLIELVNMPKKMLPTSEDSLE